MLTFKIHEQLSTSLTAKEFILSDANLLLFGEVRQFFDQMGHFCESSRTDEKKLGVLGGGKLGNCECAFFI